MTLPRFLVIFTIGLFSIIGLVALFKNKPPQMVGPIVPSIPMEVELDPGIQTISPAPLGKLQLLQLLQFRHLSRLLPPIQNQLLLRLLNQSPQTKICLTPIASKSSLAHPDLNCPLLKRSLIKAMFLGRRGAQPGYPTMLCITKPPAISLLAA